MKKMTHSMESLISRVNEIYANNPKIGKMFENGITNTFETTLKPQEDGSTFVITGDIPAMWLRDSSAQVRPLLILAKQDEEIFSLIKGVIERQKRQILIDPYANAFNKDANGLGFHDDLTDMKKEVWERKFEIDSLCYPIQLAYLFWKNTDYTNHFDGQFLEVIKTIIETFIAEQSHEEKSPYRFMRVAKWLEEQPERVKYETLQRNGLGTKVSYTGMIWSGFRPSDDACQYGYLVPSNMFAVVILKYIVEIVNEFYNGNKEIIASTLTLISQIEQGIKQYAIVNHPEFGQVYAYEVDGLGHYLLMDDANVPSLLSAPYLGYCDFDDEIYQNTRNLLLSKTNPFYYEGKVAKGIGSPHTPENYIWHIALAMQGLTSIDEKEKSDLLDMFLKTDANTNLMHEGFDVDQPERFTRPWFSWANSMFAEFLLSLNNIYVQSTPLMEYKKDKNNSK